jgi:hypothetical protein
MKRETKYPSGETKCPCGNPLKTKDETSMKLCRQCLETGITTERSKVPIPKESCLGIPGDMNRQALDRLLWLIDWWDCAAQQSSPEEAEYVAARLEELGAKIRRTI